MFSMNARDYDQSRSLFKIEVPEQFNFGFDVIDRNAEGPLKRALL